MIMLDKYIRKGSSYFYFVFRVVVGLIFFLHGAQKFGIIGDGNINIFAGAFGFPIWLAFIAGIIELVGGLLIALGFFTRLAAFFGLVQMLVALIIVHFPNSWNPLLNGGEPALLFLSAFLVIIVYGAKKLSLEKFILKREIF